jgi:hypothetical protein
MIAPEWQGPVQNMVNTTYNNIICKLSVKKLPEKRSDMNKNKKIQ